MTTATAKPATPTETPARVQRLVVGALGSARWSSSRSLSYGSSISRAPDLLPFAGAVAAVLIGDIKLVEIRIGHNGNSFTWAEAALILGVFLIGWNWFILLGRRDPVRPPARIAPPAAEGGLQRVRVRHRSGRRPSSASAWCPGSLEPGPAADLTLRTAIAWIVAAAIFLLLGEPAVAIVVALVPAQADAGDVASAEHGSGS